MKQLFLAFLLLAGSVFAQEDKLIAVLKSDASMKDKADACQELGRIGTRQCVSALAALLADEQLSHRARSALESIADPSADAALRQALGQVQGQLLVGVIHSLGVRKDTQAVEPIAKLLAERDPAVAQAAARALGSIGGAATQALEGALSSGSQANLPAVCEGLLRCAEAMPGPEAAALYDKLRALPNLPHHLRVASLSGAIRSRGAQGVSLMVEAIHNGSPVAVADAIRVSMDLPGVEVTRALVGAVTVANEETQILLVQTLGHRGDAAAAPELAALTQSGSINRRIAAIQSLVQLRHTPSLPVLAALVKDPDPTLANAALNGLTAFPGDEADATVVGLLTGLDTQSRMAAMSAAGQRRIAAALPALLKAAADSDAGVAGAAFKALGEIGGLAEIPGVVNALLGSKALAAGESALIAIGERQSDPAMCAEQLLPGLAMAKGEAKLALLRVLGTLGGSKALDAVRAEAKSPDESVRQTVCQALCDWPTADALADLARMTRTTADPRLKLLALRGQLRLIPLQKANTSQQVAQIRELLPVIEQLKEQRLALSTLGGLHDVESLALVLPYASKAEFKEEAGVAAVGIAEHIVSSHPAEVAAAMKQIQTSNSQLAGRVRQVLAKVPAGAIEVGFTAIFNGKDLTGWEGKPDWWRVEDGALVAESTPEKPCEAANYLIWRGGQPADFELLADFRLSGAGNSGIQLRSRALPDCDTSGYQADMSGDGALVGFVYEHTRGLIAGRGERVSIGPDGKRDVQKFGDAAELGQVYKKEAWNTYRIICRGPDITLLVNGTLMCQFTDRDGKQAASKGIIALQMHPGPPMKIEFKNIRLKAL